MLLSKTWSLLLNRKFLTSNNTWVLQAPLSRPASETLVFCWTSQCLWTVFTWGIFLNWVQYHPNLTWRWFFDYFWILFWLVLINLLSLVSSWSTMPCPCLSVRLLILLKISSRRFHLDKLLVKFLLVDFISYLCISTGTVLFYGHSVKHFVILTMKGSI